MPTSHARAVRGIVAAFGVASVGFGAMAPFLVLWGHDRAGLAGSAAGLLFVAQALGEIAGGLGGGLLADRLGGRQVLLVSTAGMTAGYGSLALVHAAPLALAIIFAAGLFEAAFHPTALALVGDLTPAGERTRIYGIMRAAANLGTIAGPLAGALVVSLGSTPDVFLVTAALLAAAGVAIVVSLPARAARVDLHEEAEELQAAVPGLKAIARDRRLGLLVAGGGLLAITLAWWEADGLAIVRDQRAFSTTDFSLMLALAAAITVVFQIPITRITRDVAVGRLLATGATIQAAGLALLAAAHASLAVVGAAVALVAFGQMLYGPNLTALVSAIAPRGRGATYQAAISTTADVGMAAGPASGLALAAGAGARATWLLALPLGLAAAAFAARAAPSGAPVAETEREPAYSTA